MPQTETTYKFLAPVLSAQFITAATGKAKVVRNLLPEMPLRPVEGEKSIVRAEAEMKSEAEMR